MRQSGIGRGSTCLLSPEQAPWRDRPFLGFRRFSSELLLAKTHGALGGSPNKREPSLCGGIGADGRCGAVAGAEMPIKMRQQSPESDQFFVSLSSTEPLKRRLDVLLSGRTCSAFTSAYYGIDAGEGPYDWVLSLVERSTFVDRT
jgi:hypothetical protein